jgi:hypothetical protein
MGMEALMKLVLTLMRAAGIKAQFREVEVTPDAFTRIGQAATLHGARMLQIQATQADGSEFHGLMVLNPPGPQIPTGSIKSDTSQRELAAIST